MARKGSNGRGSIYQDKHGIWWAQMPPDEYSKRPKASARTEQDAVKRLRGLEQQRDKRLDLRQGRQTIEQLLNLWLDEYVTPKAKPKTIEGHRFVCKQYIIPHLGRVRLDMLNAIHIQRWLNNLRNTGLSESTLKNAYMRLKTALNMAVQARLIAENLANQVESPRIAARDMCPLTPVEVARLFEAAHGHRLAALLHVAIRLGLRRGELIGLRWVDLDWVKSELRVVGQIQLIGGKPVRTTPKSRAGQRALPLDSELMEILRSHQANQAEEQQLLGDDWQANGLVFASTNGTPLDVRSLARQIDALLAAAELPHKRIHDLRHTAATLMLAAGVSLTDVSKILGHSNPEVTARVYAHSLEANRRHAVEAVARLLNGEKQ